MLDETFSLIERHNDPVLVLRFTEGELFVTTRDGRVYTRVSDDDDIITGVHDWLERTRPDAADLVVPGPVGFLPRVHEAVAELLTVYKNR